MIGKIQQTTSTTADVYEIQNKFSDFVLNTKLSENITSHGYTKPTPIQDRAIPKILSGLDVVGLANTGTGKTAAFLIPLINKVCLNRGSRVLIITPTRELASQISKEFKSFSAGLGINFTTCIGGLSIRHQINELDRNPHFVIGTPGRLLDLFERKKVDFGRFDSIVLDEVDRMLDMGFINDINKIISKFPKERQSLFFAATLDEKGKGVMRRFVNNPTMISVKITETRDNIKQDIVEIKGRHKPTVLRDLLREKDVSKALIFMKTKRSANDLLQNLSHNGFRVAVMHGNKSQNQRQKALDMFRQGGVDVLIATDVAARGLDINDISHVVNYDLPESYEVYIHRIGRTGRGNKNGTAITLVS
ncbi:DEAD/DEAH box helicase [Patescibacteria group bacterium]|nr:DEAD/DEAH box helicase [Patescibacteria group bacterium]